MNTTKIVIISLPNKFSGTFFSKKITLASATEISRQQNPETLSQHITVAKSGGNVAKVARAELESKLGRSVISSAKASDYLKGGESPKEIE